jgi:hypothetical protein
VYLPSGVSLLQLLGGDPFPDRLSFGGGRRSLRDLSHGGPDSAVLPLSRGVRGARSRFFYEPRNRRLGYPRRGSGTRRPASDRRTVEPSSATAKLSVSLLRCLRGQGRLVPHGFAKPSDRTGSSTRSPNWTGHAFTYLELLPTINAGTIELPDDDKLLRELRCLERRRGTAGRDRVDHPPGQHDDRANALAGVVNELAHASDQALTLVAPIVIPKADAGMPYALEPWPRF